MVRMSEETFMGLSSVVNAWRKVKSVDWSNVGDDWDKYGELTAVLDQADRYMEDIEKQERQDGVAVDPMPAWTIYANDPDAVSMHRYHKMIAGQRGDRNRADTVQRHLDQVLLWRERHRIAMDKARTDVQAAIVEHAKQEDTVDVAPFHTRELHSHYPNRKCNSVKAHQPHAWEDNPNELFWCYGRRMSMLTD